ncbi:MAG TPA: protein kinase [Gemmatimonadaceae bacterium]|nr:protein kinase [Gemmatimonadaceae bacterium]
MSQTNPAVDRLFLGFQQTLAGRYSIDRELGRGGMGIVYMAREVHLDRPVAIKLLPPERAATQPQLRDRFLREARLAAKLSHPNIIPIHAVEERDGYVYYVMAFVDGETLAQRVRTRGPLPSTEAARLLREVAWALAYAHGQGVVHRDVKPDNILLETASGRALVADFGIAAAAGDASADGVAGTPEFMSPEQALGTIVDARSDIYALGATAFYTFSGRFPFEGSSATEVLAKQVTEAAPPLTSTGLSVPRKLATLVDHCLAKDPAQRPQSAQAVAEQLGVALEKRRELPAALRAFAKRGGRLNGSGTMLSGLLLLPTSLAVAYVLGQTAGFAVAQFAGYSTFFLGLFGGPLAYLTYAARKLMLLGFGHRDVEPAFNAELEQAREELTIERRKGATAERLEQTLPKIAKWTGLSWVALVAASFSPMPRDMLDTIGMLSGLSAAAMSFSLLGLVVVKQRYSDVDTEFWAKVWRGPIGKIAFRMARKLVGKRSVSVAMTHRATELSLGMAAEQLYESLPREQRQGLGELPAVLRRLQDDAQSLRKRYDELQEALNDAGAGPGADAYADVRALRDSIHAKLGDAVAAMETIRLNLLRLHAGSATVESLTTHLGIAAEVSAEVERLIRAHQEVERTLRFPRDTAPTPA